MHIPVLKEKVIEILDPKENENFIDCTFGEGGHTKAILKKTAPNGKVLAVEIDPVLYEKGKELERKFKGRLILIHGSFKNLKAIVRAVNFSEIKGILFDLGVCSWHFESAKRGFSFKREEPLIMRY
ncbi:16S rRNA (cytosine(1402)-N(4))-methyltransferase, partial [Candidatus Parcubacteria bacterium]|nr:16S rRNA (cytosine(1402)-N(4))-methyltransferase [Candidatus Parcubacteria bacterium]